MVRGLLPRLGDFVFVCIFAGAMLLGQRMLNVDSDLGRHLTLGTYIINSADIPVRDLLSFTMTGQPRPPYEWLSEVAFALANRVLGLDGVVLLTAAVIAMASLLVFNDARERSDAPLIALALTVWAAAASSLHWLTRPHIFSFLLLVIWLRILEHLRLGRKPGVWQLPLVMLVWVNLHGAFIIGFLAWAAYMAGWLLDRKRDPAPAGVGRRLILVGGISLLASVATPSLWGNWVAVLRNTSAFVISRTTETRALDFSRITFWPFVGLLGLVLLLGFLNRSRLTSAHAFLLLGLGILAIAFVRNIPLFALAAVPISTTWAHWSLSGQSRLSNFEAGISRIDSGLKGAAWSMLVVAMAIGLVAQHDRRTQETTFQYDPALFPVRAADWLEGHPIEGNMFNDINWGGYLLYRIWPGQRVFIDSQTDFYGEQFTREYADILAAAPNWEDRLKTHDVSWVVVSPGSELAGRIMGLPEWEIAYEDETSVILARR